MLIIIKKIKLENRLKDFHASFKMKYRTLSIEIIQWEG